MSAEQGMGKVKKLIIFINVLFILFQLEINSADLPFLENYIKQNNLNCTFITESLKSGERHVYNEKRSNELYLPASTFKIINTLIILQEGAVKNENEYIKWDGKDKGFPQWNKDQNLLSAFTESCVWFYRECAKRVGNERYLHNLKKINYGNCKTGKNIDTFWLSGDLRISAKEQVEIMKNILLEKYDFNKNYYAILKKLMIVDKNDNYVLRAKTGWTVRAASQIGWYAGYIETKDDTWFFACNLDILKPEDASFREKITYQAFNELGIIK